MNSLRNNFYLLAVLAASALLLYGCSEGGSSSTAVEVTSQVAFIYSENA